jgi:quinol monooxygenase YgiN
MSVVRINEFSAAPGQAEALRQFLSTVIAVIEQAEGCRGCELLTDPQDASHFVIVERWDGVAAHQTAASRIPPEQMAMFKSLVAEPPRGRYYHPVLPNARHPRVVELLDHLDVHRASLRAAVESVPIDSRDRRPAEDRWSVAEILEHLGIVETRIAGVIEQQVETGRATGLPVETETASVLPSLDVSNLLDRSVRRVSGDASLPTGQLDAVAAWTTLEQARLKLRQVVIAADGLALGNLSAPHPRLGSLNLYQWLIFLGGHEGRHALQIREVGEALAASEAAQ